MRIKQLICAPGRTGFYFDDQKAIKAGARMDGNIYIGEAKTDGFTSVRQAGESVSLMLILEDGQIAYGDCAAVQYSGAGGRDPLFLAADFIPLIEKEIAPLLVGKELGSFREMMDLVENFHTADGKRLHTAIRYGLSQVLLDALAKAGKKMICEVVAEEYDLDVSTAPIPIFCQSGDSRYENADKMIIKQADVMPHALINNVQEKLGNKGELLQEYLAWLSERIQTYRLDPEYNPVLHIDVYGTIGQAFGDENYVDMADYLETLVEAAAPFHLRIEGPMDGGSKAETIKHLSALSTLVDERGIAVELVADEWCNTYQDVVDFVDAGAGHMIQVKTPDLGGLHKTIEATLYCKENGVKAYQGGTCNETVRSAQICTQVAMATQPDQILAKPGMGVDEGLMIVYNEMQDILALRRAQ
ncbi:MAG TPA: methylaspartate ammonia-lyase [Fastidiosipila sp.]|jgi:methylaspartate ammonia-lyase|nr:methylaspartate ammonia-lyase [Fastidiosipila sp.]